MRLRGLFGRLRRPRRGGPRNLCDQARRRRRSGVIGRLAGCDGSWKGRDGQGQLAAGGARGSFRGRYGLGSGFPPKGPGRPQRLATALLKGVAPAALARPAAAAAGESPPPRRSCGHGYRAPRRRHKASAGTRSVDDIVGAPQAVGVEQPHAFADSRHRQEAQGGSQSLSFWTSIVHLSPRPPTAGRRPCSIPPLRNRNCGRGDVQDAESMKKRAALPTCGPSALMPREGEPKSLGSR